MSTKKVRILFDHQVFSLQNYGGITAYYERLIPGLNNYDIQSNVSLLISSNYQISRIKEHVFLDLSEKFVRKFLKYIYFLINSIYTIILINFSEYDIYHATYYETFFLRYLGNRKLVLTIYDCTYEESGVDQKWSNRIIVNRKKLINRADVIIAISNEVKNDILKYYKIPSRKIKVVYLFSPLGKNSIRGDRKLLKSKRFVLYVGTREFNKNFGRFLEAFGKVNAEFPDISLTCLGGGAITTSEKFLIERLGLSDDVEHIPIKTDQDTINFFHGALMFVYPSLKEGFGIPILNAFVCGCPVVASDIPVFREVANTSFLSFDPLSVDNMYYSMRKVVLGDAIVQNNIISGYKCVKKYSADRMTRETAKIYKSLLD